MKSTTLVVTLALILSGCASGKFVYVDPMIDMVSYGEPLGGHEPAMPQLNKAITSIDTKRKELEGKRNAVVTGSRWLDVVTFGLAASAAGYSLHTAHHANAVTNLAFAAGATYTGSVLFLPHDQAGVYEAGIRALACIVQKGAALRGVIVSAKERTNTDAGYPEKYVTCKTDPINKQLDQANQLKQQTLLLEAHAESADLAEADSLIQATQSVIVSVNDEILARSNNPAAVLDSARSLASPISGTVIQGIQPSSPAVLVAKMNKLDVHICASADEAATVSKSLTGFIADYQQLNKSLVNALNATASLDKACTFEPPKSVAALTLVQNDITVPAGKHYFVGISGGRPPYNINAEGSVPEGLDVHTVLPNSIFIGADASTKATGASPVVYLVTDSSVVVTPQKLKITITSGK